MTELVLIIILLSSIWIGIVIGVNWAESKWMSIADTNDRLERDGVSYKVISDECDEK